ncbi:MAG: KH domain-containing protein [Bacilli bacterium]|nr:KH domain-containing protein [Bacilli bacterium]MBQ7105883.1 KH domain-containing protein [Bacilli bacterium]
MEKYEFIGKSREEALSLALEELKVLEKDLIINEKEQKGGLFKSKKVILEVVKTSDIVAFIKESIVNITKAMGIDVKIEVKERNDILNIVLYSENNNILIGKNGRTIDALSLIVKQMILNEVGKPFKFNLDVAEYKLKQQKRLESLAKRIAREVSKTKIDAKLDPMNSYERRIVHNILTDHKFVYTESEGEEPNRYVVIKSKEDK